MLPFYKFHGAGNDFVMIDNRTFDVFNNDTIAHICNRHLGVGADGLILLEEDTNSDFKMRYFNADGGEASFCGNGARCIVAFAHWLKIISKSCDFQAFDGIHHADILAHDGQQWQIKVEMKHASDIQTFEDGYFIDTGSPHFVVMTEDVHRLDVKGEGSRLRHDPRFAQGTNVNFLMPYKDGIYVRTFERGVEDETLSCGTGVTASAIIYALKINKEKIEKSIPVYTKGGAFVVEFILNETQKKPQNIQLTGEVVFSFRGEVIF
jgi:diaminopimelate epimerase